jgi:hypothetical protein
MLRNAFRNRAFETVDLRVVRSFPINDRIRLQFYGDLFNAFNSSNVAFISSIVYPANPAFVYGPGVLTNGSPAPADPGFLRLRTANGGYDPVSTAQQSTPFQAQLGLRLLF